MDDDLAEFLNDMMQPDVIGFRVLPDGRTLTVEPLFYGRARLGVTPAGAKGYYSDQW